jgi:hypothetical protein
MCAALRVIREDSSPPFRSSNATPDMPNRPESSRPNITPAPIWGATPAVVDDDIDIWDMNDILWALYTRVDPVQDIDFIRRGWSGPLDPIVPRDKKGFSSRAIIDACRPYEWLKDFPRVSGASTALKKTVLEKFGKYLS